MRQRAVGILRALAVVIVVAVLARPSQPDAPSPFTVEQATPEADPEPAPTAEPVQTETAGGQELTIHRIGGRSLDATGTRTSVVVPGGHARAELSPDGLRLFVATPQPYPEAATLVRVVDTAGAGSTVDVSVPAFADWLAFTPDGGGLVWLENHAEAGLRVGGAGVAGGQASRLSPVRLPPGVRVVDVAALPRERVGVVTFDHVGRYPDRWRLGDARLLVADLRAGELVTDLALPVSDGIVVDDEGGRVELIPGVAWDTARELLYVAHADHDEVLVVDAAGSRIDHEVSLRAADAAERSAPVPARATVGVYRSTWRHALLAPAGRVLYVDGSHTGPVEGPDGDEGPWSEERPLPLRALDVEARDPPAPGEELPVRVLAASAGGEHIAVVDDRAGSGRPPLLRLLDGQSLAERWWAPLATGSPPPRVWFSEDGDLLAIAQLERSRSRVVTQVWLADVATGLVLDRREFSGEVLDLDLEAGVVLERTPG
jgi:hypothetical protein